MKSEDPHLSKSSIDYRFGKAIEVILYHNIALSKGDIADELGVKPAKFSEILNGRMHVGVDMLAMLADRYLVDPDWLLTGRGENMFRPSSILPTRKNDGEELQDHPYLNEDEDEVMAQRVEQVEAEMNRESDDNFSASLLSLIKDKDNQLLQQAEELGRLKERIAQLEREKNDSSASYQTAPRVPSKSTVDL